MSDRDVPTIILCGGRGARISEVNPFVPKPMLPIGDRPILWHIMKIYSAHGHSRFVLALGHLGEVIREFFLHYRAMTSDFTIELGHPESISFLDSCPEKAWRITCADTGFGTLTGTRVRRAAAHLSDKTVMVTYGDGVGNVDVNALLEFHEAHGRLATLAAVHPAGRFGELVLDADEVVEFAEKPQTSTGAISGGFMVFAREAIDQYIPPDRDVMLEQEPLSRLAIDRQLMAYRHDGFWQPMDTPRERELLEDLWNSGKAPWKVWD